MEEIKSMSTAELVANATRIIKPTTTGIEDPITAKEGISYKQLDPRGHNVLERIALSRGIKPLDYQPKYDSKAVDKHIDEDTTDPIIIIQEEEKEEPNPEVPPAEDDSIIEFSEELDELEEENPAPVEDTEEKEDSSTEEV
jgi:hypothetical protein